MPGSPDLPLAGVRVLDLADGDGEAVTRLLADLGADVLKIEPPDGSAVRRVRPCAAGTSIPFAMHNANKRSAVLDPADDEDRRRFVALVTDADIVVDDGIPGAAASFGTSCEELTRRFGHLVGLSVTDFGSSGPYAAWPATDPVLYAMSTALSRSGPASGTPVLPPDGIASATAAVQAAWAALVAYYHRLRYGTGDYIDFARFEAVVQALDPPFGAMGQGALAQRRSDAWRGRPRNQDVYPTFACADGFVRICVMSPRQWHAMRAWLGEPEDFADPKYETIGARFAATREINALIAKLFADQSMDELVAAGQRYGIPIAAVLTPAQALSSEHFQAVGALTKLELAGVEVPAPTGSFVVDGHRAGLRRPAPTIGADTADWAGPAAQLPTGGQPGRRPFDGMRIVDLGIIVAGGELGRLFADQGAEVVKVENVAYPDGLRQTRASQPMSEAFAWAHRNKYGLGADLRKPGGAALFARLVAESDAVFANFKPGTLASLGFSYEHLREINPRIVLAESSAFGDTGPWRSHMGYGPLVRAATGIARLWTSGKTGGKFYDAVTVFPDHIVARIVAIAALAAIIRRDRTGAPAHVHISQAEAAVNQLDVTYVAAEARAAGLPVADNPATHGVYPCAGDDEWCVISVRDDADWRALTAAMGREGLDRRDCDAAAEIASWTSTLDKQAVTEILQKAGVPAGPMNRPADVLADPQLQHRKLYAHMAHPLFDAALPSETGPAPFRNIPPAELRPAPMPGEHSPEVCQKVLGLSTAEVDELIADGALFTSSMTPREGSQEGKVP